VTLIRAYTDIDEIVARCRAAFELASSVDWRSYDPFDALLLPFGAAAQGRSPLLARVTVQAGRRSGARLRRLARIRPHEEAKALADFLAASARLARLPAGEWASSYQHELIHRLAGLSVRLCHGRAWGLSFPYSSRFVSVPARTPNAYTTVCCVDALLDLAETDRDASTLELANAGARAISTDLGIVRSGGRSWFRYWPGDDTCIVNIQALVAGCFQRLGLMTDDRTLCAQAELAAEAVRASQRGDGSFPYSTDSRGQFTDSFHTGFVLEGLTRFRLNAPDDSATGVQECVDRGIDYLRTRLTGPGYLPRRSPGGRVVRDGQNVGQLIQTLVSCGRPSDRQIAGDLWLRWSSESSIRGAATRSGRQMASLRWEVGPTVLAGARLAAALTEDRQRP
jgi:hypothetical protein